MKTSFHWLVSGRASTAHREQRPGYTVHRFPSGVGFAIGRDPHVFKTWRMDGEYHAHVGVRNFATLEQARHDMANRLRFHRLMLREG